MDNIGDIWNRLFEAYENKRGIRLSAEEVSELTLQAMKYVKDKNGESLPLKRKVIQMAGTDCDYILCDDGTMFKWTDRDKKWVELTKKGIN